MLLISCWYSLGDTHSCSLFLRLPPAPGSWLFYQNICWSHWTILRSLVSLVRDGTAAALSQMSPWCRHLTISNHICCTFHVQCFGFLTSGTNNHPRSSVDRYGFGIVVPVSGLADFDFFYFKDSLCYPAGATVIYALCCLLENVLHGCVAQSHAGLFCCRCSSLRCGSRTTWCVGHPLYLGGN